jgi:NADH-quinone oxidoreductase subunit H
MALLVVLYMLIRWTIPRFRFDQLMGLAWKVLIPVGLVNLVFVMVVKHLSWNPWWLTLASMVLLLASAYLTLLPRSPRPGRPSPENVRPPIALAR